MKRDMDIIRDSTRHRRDIDENKNKISHKCTDRHRNICRNMRLNIKRIKSHTNSHTIRKMWISMIIEIDP